MPSSTGVPTASAAPSPVSTAGSVVTGHLPAGLGSEVSGVAASRVHDGVWVVDDEPGTDRVHLVSLEGGLLGTVVLAGTETVNVEDLAVGPCPDRPGDSCLVVADIGDNVAARDDVALLHVPEDALRVGEETTLEPSVRRLALQAPVDAEALVVADDGTVVLVDRTPDRAGVHVAAPGADAFERVGEVVLPTPRRALQSLVVGRVVTAADLRPDGRSLLLRTYDQVLELTPPGATGDAGGPDLRALPTWDVREVPSPVEPQGEAIAHLDDTRFVTVSEGSTAIIVTTR